MNQMMLRDDDTVLDQLAKVAYLMGTVDYCAKYAVGGDEKAILSPGDADNIDAGGSYFDTA